MTEHPDSRRIIGYLAALAGAGMGLGGAIYGYHLTHNWFGIVAGAFFPLALLGGLFIVGVLGFGLGTMRRQLKSSPRESRGPKRPM